MTRNQNKQKSDLNRLSNLVGALTTHSSRFLIEWLDANQLTIEDVRWLITQGLAPYIYYNLKTLNVLADLPDDSKVLLQKAYYASALREAVQHREVLMILAALTKEKVETVLMKGTALAHTVYPNSRCRLKADLDLWIQPHQLDKALSALQKMGYYSTDQSEMVQLYGVQHVVNDMPDTGLVELQWPAIRSEWVRLAANVEHEKIWERREPFNLDGQPTHIMTLEDILLHLCVHFGINHHFGQPWLRGLLDIHLVAQSDSLDWNLVKERAQAWRISTVTWTVLALVQKIFGTIIPKQTLAALSPSPQKQWVINKLKLKEAILQMNTNRAPYRRLMILLLMVDKPQETVPLVSRTLFPEKEWIKTNYSTHSIPELWFMRLSHPLRLLISKRVW